MNSSEQDIQDISTTILSHYSQRVWRKVEK